MSLDLGFNNKEVLNKRVGIIGYIPPVSFNYNTLQFIKNINEFESFSDKFLFSDGDYENTIKVEDPLSIVEKDKDRIGIWTFYKCLMIAKEHKLDYFLMIESDCRVCCNNWDYGLFVDAIRSDSYAFGNLNVCNFDQDSKVLEKIKKLNCYKNFNYIDHGNGYWDSVSRIWTNGALTVYNTNIFYEFLHNDIGIILREWKAWDWCCCSMIVDKIGIDESIKKILHSENIVSNIESIIPLEYIIKNWKKYVAVHPVKTDWSPGI